jgi:hypothetical protein
MSRKPLTSSPAFQLKKCSRNFVDDPTLKLEIPLMSGEKKTCLSTGVQTTMMILPIKMGRSGLAFRR